MKDVTSGVVVPLEQELPPERQRVILIRRMFRCLGYMDEKGVWRDDARSEELEDVVGWVKVPESTAKSWPWASFKRIAPRRLWA